MGKDKFDIACDEIVSQLASLQAEKNKMKVDYTRAKERVNELESQLKQYANLTKNQEILIKKANAFDEMIASQEKMARLAGIPKKDKDGNN